MEVGNDSSYSQLLFQELCESPDLEARFHFGSHYVMTRTDPLSQMIEAACEAAIKRAMKVSDISPRRLLTVQEAAVYLALSEREVYNMVANKELTGVRHGRRLMVDIRDLEEWVATHKAA
jgi:excisionase family DNA binding protein